MLLILSEESDKPQKLFPENLSIWEITFRKEISSGV